MGRRLAASAALTAGVLALAGATAVGADGSTGKGHRHHVRGAGGGTATPIKHVIVILGENHTFDNVFATYKPPKGESVENFLSEGIVTANGEPGPNVSKAEQNDRHRHDDVQPRPEAHRHLQDASAAEHDLREQGRDGQDSGVPDSRFPADLANAPYQITKYVPYFDSDQYAANGTCEFIGPFVGDPIHRFYEMYQEIGHNSNDLWTWVHETSGISNGDPQPSPFTDQSTQQGANEMGFYNMAGGDEPTLKRLARHYTMSDNFHQGVQGGTGANHIMLGTGAAAFYQDSNGQATTPPAGEIENPNPQPGTNNWYTQDGYGKAAPPTAAATRTARTTRSPACRECSTT